MKRIAVINQKGGSGKTTTAIMISLALAGAGGCVLAVDCDPQGGLSDCVAHDRPEDAKGTFDLIVSGAWETRAIDNGGICYQLLPADYRLDKIYASMSPYELEKHFTRTQYDFVVFDTPPTMQGITRAAAMVADVVIVPADVSRATIRPTLYTLDALRELRKTGRVYLIGKEPDGRRGYLADVARDFIQLLGDAYAGIIPRALTYPKLAHSNSTRWTPARRERYLAPFRECVLQ